MGIILASASPRRRELLSLMGLSYEVMVSDAEEIIIAGENPKSQVERLSKTKADAIIIKENDVVIAADTVVVSPNGEILGKPRDKTDALNMLMLLSGKTHSVFTGVTVKSSEKSMSFSVESRVTFIPFNEQIAKAYINTGEPMDKAGAYGIQGKGGMLVERIDGDYFNIVGLPICPLREVLYQFNISVL